MSQITLDSPGQHHYVRSVSNGGIRIGDQMFNKPLLLSAQRLVEDWNAAAFEELEGGDFEPLWELQPEVVLIGTGTRQQFLHPSKLTGFYERGIGVEMMTTEAACRTFNVLVLEGRQVAAALFPLDETQS